MSKRELFLLLMIGFFSSFIASAQETKSGHADLLKVERTIVRSVSRFADDQIRISGLVTVIDAHTCDMRMGRKSISSECSTRLSLNRWVELMAKSIRLAGRQLSFSEIKLVASR